jgi:hypothetical protein
LRKARFVAVAVIAAFGIASIAYAATENTYTVNGTVTGKKGKKKKPVPIALSFGYTVRSVEGDAVRPDVVQKYAITFEGGRVNTSIIPGCSEAQVTAAKSTSVCPKKSIVGRGSVEAVAGASGIQSDQSIACHLDLTILNGKGKNKATLYLHGATNNPNGPCAVPIDQGIDAKYTQSKKGVTLSFTVPDPLLHQLNGALDVSVKDVKSKINKIQVKKGKGKKARKVGYYESFGCKGKNVVVTFTKEDGTTAQASAPQKCT